MFPFSQISRPLLRLLELDWTLSASCPPSIIRNTTPERPWLWETGFRLVPIAFPTNPSPAETGSNRYFLVKRSKTLSTGRPLPSSSKKPRLRRDPVTAGSHQNIPIPRLFGVLRTMRLTSSRNSRRASFGSAAPRLRRQGIVFQPHERVAR